MDGENFFYIL